MIAKITHGRSAARALAYDHGPGRADEHHNPRKVAGNVAGRDWRIRAHHIQRFITAHQQDAGDRGVYRIALANPDTDRVLSDREWREVAEKFVARFGADQGMWEATRHDRHHIHLTISKDRFDGTRMSTSHDYRRVAAICRELEREHHLTNAADRSGRGSGRVRASTGRIAGISYARAATSGRAEPIWFKGSQLGKAYGWNQVSGHLRDNIDQHGPQQAASQRGGG